MNNSVIARVQNWHSSSFVLGKKSYGKERNGDFKPGHEPAA